MSAPFALKAYRGLSVALAPFAGALLSWRARNGKEEEARIPERFGHASTQRPEGKLVWLHGASVGEARLLLQVQAALAEARGDLNFLITTGTVTSAGDVKKAARARTIHQYAPLDDKNVIARFLAHWKPDVAVFAESEVWPNILLETKAAGVPLALINARFSPKSLEGWARFRDTAAILLQCYDTILAVDRMTAAGLEAITRQRIEAIGNLKLAAPAPHADAALVDALKSEIGARKTWLAASTHEGEEEIVLEAHEQLRRTHPDALVFIAPRHPARGAAIAALAGGAPQRSRAAPVNGAAAYIVDTMGELGAYLTLAPATFMGGSLKPTLAGHNPVEPAKAGSAVLSGPYVQSFGDLYADLFAAGGAMNTPDAAAIAAAINTLWTNETARARQVQAALGALADGGAALVRTRDALLRLLDKGVQAKTANDAAA